MVGVDVGRNLEDKARKLRLFGLYLALLGLGGTRTGGYLNETVQKFLHAKVVQGRTKEYWRHLGRAVGFYIELRVDAVHQFQVFTQLVGVLIADTLVELGGTELHTDLFSNALLVRGEEVEVILIDVIHALELGSLVDGPRQGSHLDFQLLFQLVEQVEGVAALAVHLIDEDDDRRLPHAADRHQLARLSLHTLGTVDHNDG